MAVFYYKERVFLNELTVITMTEYELLYLVGEQKKAELDTIRKEVEMLIEKHGGEVLAGEFVDERKMEYPIRKERRGVYIAKRFQIKGEGEDIPGAIGKDLQFLASILRFIIVRAEGLPTLEESQERVRRVPTERKRPASGGHRAPMQRASQAIAPTPKTPAPSDKEIDEKLEKVLDI